MPGRISVHTASAPPDGPKAACGSPQTGLSQSPTRTSGAESGCGSAMSLPARRTAA